MEKPVIHVIAGPTASGKTAFGIQLAKKNNGEIVSADSMQIYKGMDIGTAKPTKQEMEGIPHHMLDVVCPSVNFTVADYSRLATQAINAILSRGKVPIVVGGTGFYINAIIRGSFHTTDETQHKKERALMDSFGLLAQEKGAEHIYAMLVEIDPEYANSVHPNNVKKVVRALSFCHANIDTGKLFSSNNQAQKKAESAYSVNFTLINMPRNELYNRINMRVLQMWEQGLAGEVRQLIKQGISHTAPAMQGIGYKETMPYINGQQSQEETIRKIQQATRNYAKRQDTWFKHQSPI